MKFHWGIAILVTFVIFAAGILLLVTISMRENIDLVADDYYDRELKYQEQIDRSHRTALLGDSIRIQTTPSEVTIQFPPGFREYPPTGTVTLYRPSDRRKDVSIPLTLDGDGSQRISLAPFDRGAWKLKLEWVHRGAEYYHQEIIILQ